MKNKLIIFDFLRTIYDPDKEEFIKGAPEVLIKLKRRNNILVLYTSKEGDANRQEVINRLELDKYFDKILLVESKTKEIIIELINRYSNTEGSAVIVGDRVKKEVVLGNEIGCLTIWFKQGKYAEEIPVSEVEQPDIVISELTDLL